MNLVKKFQAGGAMPVDEAAYQEAPVAAPQEGGQDPLMQIVQMFAQGLQNQDCNLLAQGAEMFLQLIEQSQGGAEQAPAGQPVFAKGGKLVGRKPVSYQLVRK